MFAVNATIPDKGVGSGVIAANQRRFAPIIMGGQIGRIVSGTTYGLGRLQRVLARP